ncbi:MAG: SEL1-like repeat protein [Candidatus Izemoplasmataceae bacterium]
MNQKILDEALKHFEARNYIKAKNLFLSLANENATAQYYLGVMYRMGLGTEDDQKEAFEWFLKAAERGDPLSQYLVGCAYNTMIGSYGGTLPFDVEQMEPTVLLSKDNQRPIYIALGIGVEPNVEEAIAWFTKAALQGQVDAQQELGFMHSIAFSEQQDNESIYWFKKAAEQGCSISTYMIARDFLYSGDIEQSIKWFEKAHTLGNEEASYELGKIFEFKIKNNPDYEMAIKWYMIAAKQHNDYESQFRLGRIYQYGHGVEKNINEALNWYKKAAIQNYKEACFKLGILYSSGKIIKEDDKQAIKWFIKAAIQHDKISESILERYYKDGFKLDKEFNQKFETLFKARSHDEKAQIQFGYDYVYNYPNTNYQNEVCQWYNKLAYDGNPDAQFLYSQICCYQFDKQRLEWLKKAADQEHTKSQYELAQMYHWGNYVKDNDIESIKYYQLAANKNANAQFDLAYYYGHGIMVEVNYIEAFKRYQCAAQQIKYITDTFEQEKIQLIKLKYNAGNNEAEAKALEGDTSAQLYLGCLYQYGFEVKRNIEKAIFWYEMANKQGANEAQKQIETLRKGM